MIQRFREWRLQQAELALADAEHHLRWWDFANTPSETFHEKKRVERKRKRVLALRRKLGRPTDDGIEDSWIEDDLVAPVAAETCPACGSDDPGLHGWMNERDPCPDPWHVAAESEGEARAQ